MSRMPAIPADGRGRRIAGLALLALAQAGAAGATAIAVRETFNRFGNAADALPTIALLILVGAGFAYAALRWYERIAAEGLGHDYANAVRLRVFSHIAALPVDRLARYRSGSLSLRFVGDLSAIRGWVGQGLVRLLSAGIVIPVVGMVLYFLDPRMALAALACLGLGLLMMAGAGIGMPATQRRLRRRRARLAGDAAERLLHAPQLRLLGRLPRERARLAAGADRVRHAAVERQRRAGLVRMVPELVQAVAAASMLWIALDGGATSGDAAAALAALALLTQPLRDLAGVWDRYAAWDTARRRCEQLLGTPRLRAFRRGRSRPAEGTLPRAAPVRFHRVSAGPLQGFDAEAAPGRRIGIAGPNAAGKSTLLALAAGLAAAERGRVRVGGLSPVRASGKHRRDLVTYVGPGAPLLSGSLRRALTLGLKQRPDDALLTATATRLGLGPTLARLGGLDGRIAENGRNLSAGEVRRLFLTRAALAHTPLLLLDEPDDALDHRGRQALVALLRETSATVLLVSHDWQTLSTLDEVWFVDDGRRVESGSPQALAVAGGPTARFFDLGRTA